MQSQFMQLTCCHEPTAMALQRSGNAPDILVPAFMFLTASRACAGRYFPENPPARACFAVQTLPANGLVEIEAIAETC